MAVGEIVYLGIGSNIERERYILSGLDAISEYYGPLTISSVYESEAYGFEGDPFYNLVVRCKSSIQIDLLVKNIKQIESQVAGRSGGAKYRARKLDIDLLLFGKLILSYGMGKVPREDILRQEYVLRPLAEIAPHDRYPIDNQTYAELLRKHFPTPGINFVNFNWCE